MSLRDDVLRTLEALRQDQKIASNQEATVSVTTDDDKLVDVINELGAETFAALCIISEMKIEKGAEYKITADKCSHVKCDRCWNYLPSVGSNSEKPDLCSRCLEVVGD